MSRSAQNRLVLRQLREGGGAAFNQDPFSILDTAQPQEEDTNESNFLPLHGNTRTMNMEGVLATNIVTSKYFKYTLMPMTSLEEWLEEATNSGAVTHLLPWEPGVAARTPSKAFMLVFRLAVLRVTERQLVKMLNSSNGGGGSSSHNVLLRGLACLYLRYTWPPADLWSWYEPYLSEGTSSTSSFRPWAANSSATGVSVPFTTWLRGLVEDFHYGAPGSSTQTILPRIPVMAQREMAVNLALLDKDSERARQNAQMGERFFVAGTAIRARFSEDGKWYPAKIQRAVDPSEDSGAGKKSGGGNGSGSSTSGGKKYWVLYDSFENTEIRNLGQIELLSYSNNNDGRSSSGNSSSSRIMGGSSGGGAGGGSSSGGSGRQDSYVTTGDRHGSRYYSSTTTTTSDSRYHQQRSATSYSSSSSSHRPRDDDYNEYDRGKGYTGSRGREGGSRDRDRDESTTRHRDDTDNGGRYYSSSNRQSHSRDRHDDRRRSRSRSRSRDRYSRDNNRQRRSSRSRSSSRERERYSHDHDHHHPHQARMGGRDDDDVESIRRSLLEKERQKAVSGPNYSNNSSNHIRNSTYRGGSNGRHGDDDGSGRGGDPRTSRAASDLARLEAVSGVQYSAKVSSKEEGEEEADEGERETSGASKNNLAGTSASSVSIHPHNHTNTNVLPPSAAATEKLNALLAKYGSGGGGGRGGGGSGGSNNATTGADSHRHAKDVEGAELMVSRGW